MRLLKFTRYSEWWEYKLVPLLSVAYLTALSIHQPFRVALPRIALLFAALIVGAIYVSVINDITDIREDAIAGKRNSMANVNPWVQSAVVLLCLLFGAYVISILYPDVLSMLFGALTYIVFTLYSVKPIRLKKRGIWGVFCDAAGAHLFPSLVMAINLMFFFGHRPNLLLTVAIGIWSFTYGLRGILWHQFSDKENDLKSGTTTFASTTNAAKFKPIEIVIFILEISALAVMLFQVADVYVTAALILYVIFVMSRRYVLHYKVFIILVRKDTPHQIIMNEYYFVFLPLSLLLSNAISFNFGWFLMLAHVLLFPSKTAAVLKDCFLILKKML
ncbi:4-hydroxybenzoate polyprenyltransferase [Pedobacter sp. UYP30]|uniref:UbiA family prenyltransferase n=1 Tax=Pedobacter sp. UYP30 TaxID=1756400 RepID=UPI003390B643